jgi:transposase-like protein
MTRSKDKKNLANLDPLDKSGHGEGDSKVLTKPQRRVFSAAYKAEILKKLKEAKGTHGAVGELLRREGLYASQVAKWKQEIEESLTNSLVKKRGPKPNISAKAEKEVARLAKENARLKESLRQMELVIDAQKKIAEILKNPSKFDEEDENT